MANVDAPHGFVPEYMLGSNGAIPMLEVLLGSNAGVQKGDPVARLTTGLAALATSSSTEILGVAQETITAIAATRQNVMIVPALESIVFSGQCSGTAAITDIGEDVDIEGTTGICEINEDASSTGVVHVLGLKPGSAWGANAELLFVWGKSSFSGRD